MNQHIKNHLATTRHLRNAPAQNNLLYLLLNFTPLQYHKIAFILNHFDTLKRVINHWQTYGVLNVFITSAWSN